MCVLNVGEDVAGGVAKTSDGGKWLGCVVSLPLHTFSTFSRGGGASGAQAVSSGAGGARR